MVDEFLAAKNDTSEENSDEADLDAQLTKIKSGIMNAAQEEPKDPIAIVAQNSAKSGVDLSDSESSSEEDKDLQAKLRFYQQKYAKMDDSSSDEDPPDTPQVAKNYESNTGGDSEIKLEDLQPEPAPQREEIKHEETDLEKALAD